MAEANRSKGGTMPEPLNYRGREDGSPRAPIGRRVLSVLPWVLAALMALAILAYLILYAYIASTAFEGIS